MDTEKAAAHSSLKESEHFEQAFKLAEEALGDGEVPVGCVFVDDRTETVIASGRNEVNRTKNACRHAELVAIDRLLAYCASEKIDYQSVMTNTTLYVTVEPCIMCAGAIDHLGLRRVIFGCRNDRFGGLGSVVDVRRSAEFKPLVAVVEVEQEEWRKRAIDLLKRFYQCENPNAPTPRLKRKTKTVSD